MSLLRVKTSAQHRAEALKVSLAAEQELFAAQIVTRSAVQKAQAEVDQALQDAASAADQITQVDIQYYDVALQSEQRVKNAEFALADAERQLKERSKPIVWNRQCWLRRQAPWPRFSFVRAVWSIAANRY